MDKPGIVSMNKKTVILATVATIAVGLVICLIFVIWLVKSSKNDQPTAVTTNKADHAKMVANYQTGIKPVLEEYQQIIDSISSVDSVNGSNKQNYLIKIKSLENKLTEIIVPAEYQDMHIKILFGLISLENYISENNIDERENGKNALSEIKKDNNWLNE